ncbi:DUF1353 domain-containing protein [Massilia timonae]|jgi:hypothetical protein|uniref:DUF1353 domain-containing protein n=1 Tax=Massilia timonae CCUG 45783 TaxID=883126 RepID=K9DC60_9BURK|nr:DUF1353 domain-containing protein [Massilia timonae]EKU80836.1 hypothetical protein HMPREF9710_04003 [Massilia timonae CCUG 45783]
MKPHSKLKRRRFLAFMSLAFSAKTTFSQTTDRDASDAWMEALFLQYAEDPTEKVNKKNPSGVLKVARFADPTYYTTSVIGWTPTAQHSTAYKQVRVPIGFVTDFASIPAIFWPRLRPDGLYAYAAVLHDYLYWEQYLTREQSDKIFRLCMEAFKVNTMDAGAIYTAVRKFGKRAWNDNARRKAKGEKRILIKTPDDPRITWNEWRKIPANFR